MKPVPKDSRGEARKPLGGTLRENQLGPYRWVYGEPDSGAARVDGGVRGALLLGRAPHTGWDADERQTRTSSPYCSELELLIVPAGHAPFALWNRTGNQLIRMLLLSPVHRLISGRLALITVTGRRTGRQHTFPVGYKRDGERVTIAVGLPQRKVWWRNLRDGAAVRLHLAGQERTGNAHVRGDERSSVSVEVLLNPRA